MNKRTLRVERACVWFDESGWSQRNAPESNTQAGGLQKSVYRGDVDAKGREGFALPALHEVER